MTAITADMMLPDFYDASGPDFTPSTSDYAALNTLLAQSGSVVEVKLGLAGIDLTKFLANCAIVKLCNSSNFNSYSGWAVFAEFSYPTVQTGNTGFVFSDSLKAVEINWFFNTV